MRSSEWNEVPGGLGAEPANKQGASVYTEALLAKMKKLCYESVLTDREYVKMYYGIDYKVAQWKYIEILV